MIISIIAAMSENRTIGKGNRLPWHLRVDLSRFRALTVGHPLIMGRKTHESIGRPLPGRKNIVITRDPAYRAEGCAVVNDLPSALAACEGAEEVFVLGGEKLFRDVLPVADRIYLTIVRATIAGDARFPEIPEDFAEVWSGEAQDLYPLRFVIYERKKQPAPGGM